MLAIARNALRTAALLLLLLPHQTHATVVPRLDFPALAHSAELVVHGRVVRHWSDWDAAHQFIWTHYLLAVTEALKGRSAATVTVSEPGGAVGGARMRIAGVPEYSDGEEVVVFLERTPIGYWRCYGWGQGKYSVTRSASGLKRIRTNLSGLELRPGAARRQGRATLPLEHLNGMDFREFKRLVQREVAR